MPVTIVLNFLVWFQLSCLFALVLVYLYFFLFFKLLQETTQMAISNNVNTACYIHKNK